MSEVEVFKAHFWQQPPEAYQGKIPFIVSDLIAVLKRLGAEHVEGVFRLNGSDRQIKELIEAIDKGRIQDWTPYSNVHTIATTLKRYFRAMAAIDPIIPFRLYNSMIEIARIQHPQKAISELKALLKKLDPGRYHTLCFLIKYLNEVSKLDHENQMPAKNIAVCFGPNLIVCDRPDSPDALNQSVLIVHVLEDMINHFEEIFEGYETIERYNCDPEDILAVMVPPLKWSHVVNLMSRNKERMKFKCIQYVPQANMHISIVNRPKRPPPPILAEKHDNVCSNRSGYAEFYGDAVGAQDLKFFIESLEKSGNSSTINLLKNIAVSQNEFKIAKPPEKPKKTEGGGPTAAPRRSHTVKISSAAPDDDIVKPKLTDDEVYVPPPEQNVYRKATLAGRRRPTVRILQD